MCVKINSFCRNCDAINSHNLTQGNYHLTYHLLHIRFMRKNFLVQYLGKWYQQDRHRSLSNLPGKCWSQTYQRFNRRDPFTLNLTVQFQSDM